MPAHPPQQSGRRRRSAFTLTELLVVIAIIVLLVALLLTALNGVQQKAKETKTLSTMQAIANACETFQHEHGYYPGAVPEGRLAEDAALISCTENLVLGLMGGYARQEDDRSEYDDLGTEWVEFEVGTQNPLYKVKVNPAIIGQGPVIRDRSFPPYYTPSDAELASVAHAPYSDDDELDLPEIVDAWGQPILYLRQLRATGPLTSDDSDDHPQFSATPFTRYLVSLDPDTQSGLGALGADQVYGSGNPRGSILTTDAATGNLAKVLEHPSLPGQTRGAFMLLSAGKDGVYLSAEDGPGSPSAPVTDITALPGTILQEYDDVLLFGGG